MNAVLKSWAYFFSFVILLMIAFFALSPDFLQARNILQYKDTISDSYPTGNSNHTFSFVINTDLDPGSYIEITPPSDFEILSTTTFSSDRNVEMSVGGSLRLSSSTGDSTYDLVEIFPGTPGMIRYTLNPTTGISSSSQIEIRVGNHTSKAFDYSLSTSTVGTSTATTTTDADIKPIVNGPTIGTREFVMEIYEGVTEVANAGFLISLVDRVGVGPADTRETIPPYRFNPAPTSTILGVTLNVEIFFETDELAVCKFSTTAGIAYASMPTTFTNTGTIYHTHVVTVVPNSLQQYYIRCIDDEGNFNTDDFLLEFSVSAVPTGTSNTEGDVSGDGSGSGDDGTGTGSGSGGTEGNSSGVEPESGGDTGSGGSGGGGGGGRGEDQGSTAGGGFESTDAPYPSGDGRVVISGYAFPRSTVYALVDGTATENVKASNNGTYEITIDEIARGAYTFGVYAIDANGTKSSTFSTSFTVTGARTSALSNINISPSIKISPDPVTPPGQVTFSGYGLPNSTITLENEKDKSPITKKIHQATTDSNGVWSLSISTEGFAVGTYKVRAKSEVVSGAVTNFSNFAIYGVGTKAVSSNADLNRDGKVNLVDFSILLFWWNSNGGNSDPSADINGDGRVSLTDFSILLFNWTG